MKGDFSRLTFQARKHYSGVLHQQGRVWLDADWNEDVQDRQFLHDQETVDVVGRSGAPEPGLGFQIGPNPNANAQPDDFAIGGGPGSNGHFYVDGLLCQLEAGVTYLSQPDYPNPQRLTMPAPGGTLTALVYLEAWQRLITYLEDPGIREVALGGPDTATRLQTVAQVKVIPVPTGTTCATAVLPTSGQGTLTTLQPTSSTPADPCRLPDPAAFTGRENHLYRVEIHDGGDVLGGSGQAQVVLLGSDIAAGAVSLTLPQALSPAQKDALQRSRAVLLADDDGLMDRIPISGISANGLTVSLSRGVQVPFRAARNARVTIGAAHFKWSRDNAAFAVPVTAISPDRKTLTVAALGRDQATALRLGDIIEISDDVSELGPGAGHLTYLSANPDPDLLTVSLSDALPSGFATPGPASPPNAPLPDRHLILRRWDGLGSTAAAFDPDSTPGMNLGNGVQVQFGGQDLRPGDFWQFVARSIDGSVQPLLNQSPAGILRHRAPLAIVRWSAFASPPEPVFQVLEDCRKIFPPLTSLYEPGFHVTGVFGVNDNGLETPLGNDTIVDSTLLSGGIRVHCDSPVDINSVERPTCFLTLEAPFVPPGSSGPPPAYQPLALRGTVGAANQIITWAPTVEARTFMSALPGQIPASDPGVLARLTLKGNFIWDQSTPPLYLDGDVLGVRSATNTTALKFPSGDRRRGGDFEMWFWLARQAPPLPLTFAFSVAVPVVARAEGITELLNDLLLIGAGGISTPVGTAVPLVNIQIFFNTTVTSPILTAPQQDAVLLIDDPTRLNTNVPTALTGVGGSGLDFKGGAAPNTFIGQVAGSNAVSFIGIPLDPPGRNAQRVFRIKNIRINATTLGGPTAPSQLSAFVTVTGPIPVPVNPTTVVAGFVQQSAIFQVINAAGAGIFTISPRNGSNVALAANNRDVTGVINVRLSFREGFATAFRIHTDRAANPVASPSPREEEAFDNQDAGALPVVGPALPNIGRATNGTRFMALFDKVPPGVQIFVTTRDVPPAGTRQNPPDNPPPKAILVRTDSSGTGGGPAGPATPGGVPLGTGGATAGIPIDAVPVVNGAGVAVWEWVSKDPPSPTTVETIEFGVLLAMAPNPSAPLGTAVVTLSLAPFSTITTASPTAPVPRFLRTTSAQPMFVVSNPIIRVGPRIGIGPGIGILR